ncbi:MAG: flavodoxin domain-containing protein [Pseudomonadota bacterium]
MIVQTLKVGPAVLLTLQVLLIGLAASAAHDHVRTDLVLAPESAASDSKFVGGTPVAMLQGEVVFWSLHEGADGTVIVTDLEGRLLNRVGIRASAAYTALSMAAAVIAAGLILLVALAAVAGRITPIAAAGLALLCVAHFVFGFGRHFEPATALSVSIVLQLLLVALGVLCLILILRRFGDAVSAGQAMLVAYASQSGTAQGVAQRLAEAAGGRCDVVCVSRLNVERLSRYDTALFVASTYGDGDPPDRALGFVHQLAAGNVSLDAVRFAVLALGDKRYANFCAFGHRLHTLMSGAGAAALLPVATVDRLEQNTIAAWWAKIAAHFELESVVPAVRFQTVSIQRNHCLNPASPARHVHCVELAGREMPYQPGDLLEIKPRFDRTTARNYLLNLRKDPESRVMAGGEELSLLEALEKLEWQSASGITPLQHGLPDQDVLEQAVIQARMSDQELIASLSESRARTYSLASAPGESSLRVVVRKRVRPDGTPGVISHQLCNATRGDLFEVAIRSNPDFHLPHSPQPLIMIAAGTGLAPFLGFLAQLHEQRRSGPHWLFFGEQTRQHDSYMAPQLQRYLEDGTLHRYITAWSREADGQYIQDMLAQFRSPLCELVCQQGAHIYVCGAQSGFGEAIHALLLSWFGTAGHQKLLDRGQIHTDLY